MEFNQISERIGWASIQLDTINQILNLGISQFVDAHRNKYIQIYIYIIYMCVCVCINDGYLRFASLMSLRVWNKFGQ